MSPSIPGPVSPDTALLTLDDLPVPAVTITVAGGQIVDANAAYRALSGGQRARCFGVPFVEQVREEDRALVEAILAQLGHSEPGPVRAFLEPSGVPVTIQMRSLPAHPDLAIAVVQDRTDEARYEAIVDATADSTLLLSADGLVLWQRGEVADPELVARIGGVGTNPLELVHPEDLPLMLDSFVNAVANPGSRVRSVARSRAAGPGDQWQRVEVSGSSQLGTPGLDAILVQVRNLGAGEQVDSLAETEGRFFSLTDAAPVGIAVGDVFGRTVYLNAAARSLFGDGSGGGVSGTFEWVDLVEPAHRDELLAAIDGAIYEGRTTKVIAPFTLSAGERKWLRVRITPRNAAGHQAIGIITTLDDVTAEVEARADSERLREMLDASSDYVAVFRPGGEVLYLNQAIRGLLERIRAEGGSGELRDLIPEQMRDEWLERSKAGLANSDVWRDELAIYGGNGQLIPISILTVLRRRDDGSTDWVAVLARDISELKRAEAQLRELATHDHLTGLPNRPLFNDRLETAVARHRRSRQGVAVMFCDLDGFKEINDELGHAAGDAVLVSVADRLQRITRESDTAARVGGDEFVMVCEGVTDSEELAALAERIIDAVSQPITLPDGEQVRVGISVGIGVAHPRQENVDPDRLLTLADTAMYRAKARGGNTFRIAALQD